MKSIATSVLLLLTFSVFTQSSFEKFKNDFELHQYPSEIKSYAEENEISEENFQRFMNKLNTEEDSQYESWFYQSRFETKNWIGFIANHYTTSGSAGTNFNNIELFTTTHDGIYIDNISLGCFCRTMNLQTYEELTTKLAIAFDSAGIAAKTIKAGDGSIIEDNNVESSDPQNFDQGTFKQIVIDGNGQITLKNQWDLVPVKNQSAKFPLLTAYDSTFKKQLLEHFGFTPEILAAKRALISPLTLLQDPYANYKMAKTYDLYPHGTPTPEENALAVKYLSQAASMNHARSASDLYHSYRYESMGLKKNPSKSLEYLHRTILLADDDMKVQRLTDLASIYYPNWRNPNEPREYPELELSVDSSIVILKRALDIDPTYTRARDFLGSIYDQKGDRQSAIKHFLQSDNVNMQIKVGVWYVKGEEVDQDIEKGLELLRDAVMKVKAKNGNHQGTDPIIELHLLHYCDKLITKAQLGDIDQGYFICSPGG